MKIVFFGASKFVLPLITMLHTNHNLTLVVTTEREETDAVPSFCKKQHIPYLAIKTITPQIQEQLQQEAATLAVLAYFGVILPKETLELFSKGILNIHPSLLPQYRGATPVQSALLSGDKETGVSIMKLDEKMDHGPLLAQEKETILATDTTESLHDRLFTKGTKILAEIIPDYVAGKISLTEQHHNKATYTKRSFTKQDGFLDLANPPSLDALDRMIRAYYPWPGVWTRITINNKEKVVKLLPEKMIQVEGKRPMNLKDFSNGYPEEKEHLQKLLELIRY